MHKKPSSSDGHVRSGAALSVAICWHLPEAESIEATVELLDELSPRGLPVRTWHVVTDAGLDDETPAWSSARATSVRALNRRARVRVTRHDGPCLLRVGVVDSAGARFTETYRFDRFDR
ncbi:hypothetical protein [Subtercola endophyticus]|uniref:hypothetical protein n=1 Tax=Subtercola endophyticus TaxID=2895559 RepID=UPI001E2C7DDD|nr:hypothetical protein [Subtercola endophyticus]UFS59957.1 hypothetical protein LQ955_04000 [Subtercola endophyticus]